MSLSVRITALAQAIGADIKALFDGKVDKIQGKSLSTNDFTDDDKAKLDALNTDEVAVGVGQSWQDLTAARVAGTPYSNGTGRPITVAAVRTTGAGSIQLTISGMVVQKEASQEAQSQGSVFGIVPPGATYIVYASPGIESWVELR
jgi:hypothetical protein